jgi:hypothetical protein
LLSDGVEVACVGGSQHEAGRDDGVGEDLAHGLLHELERLGLRRRQLRRVGTRTERLHLDAIVSHHALHMRRDRLDRVAGQEAEVDDRLGAAGQHVFLVSGVEHRHRGGGAQQRAGGSALVKLALHHRLEQPQVGHRQPLGKRQLGPDGGKHLGRRALDATGHRLRIEPRERRRQHTDGAVARGRRLRRMPGRRGGHELERHQALLGQADQCQRLLHARQDAFGHRQALVEHPGQLDPTLLEQRHDLCRTELPAHLLVVPEHKVDRALRLVAGLEQQLGSFELGDEVALVVQRAAAPHEAAFDHPGKRRLLPQRLGTGGDGHHVLVREQRHRCQLGIAALPREEQAVATHHLALQLVVHQGVTLSQVCVQRVELGSHTHRVEQAAHSLGAHRRGHRLGHRRFVDRQLWQRWRVELPRALAQRVAHEHEREQEQRCQQSERDPLHVGVR